MKGTLTFGLFAAWCLLATAGCVFHGDESTGTTGTAAPTVEPERLGVAELVSAVDSGDGLPVVLSWFAYDDDPLIEGYSFLEYTEEYAIGRAYYWGDWRTKADDYCAVRMQKNYIPISMDMTLGWYSAVTGYSVTELRDQFLELSAANGGEMIENIGQSGNRVGDRYTIDLDGTIVELLTRDAMPEERTILAMQFTLEKLEAVMVAKEAHPSFRETGTENHDATLTELIAVLETGRARGILDQFDYSTFAHHQVYAPPHDPDKVDFSEATFYQCNANWWANTDMCTVGIYDDGTRTMVQFTPVWYAENCGHSVEELEAEFDALLEANGGRRLVVDAENDDGDVEYGFCYIGEVNLLRRLYQSFGGGHHAFYMLFSGPELFPGAPEHVPSWSPEELPVVEEPGPLAEFINTLATTGIPELRAKYFYNFNVADLEYKLFEPRPFTTYQQFELMNYENHRILCRAYAVEHTFMEEIRFTPVWFEQVTGTAHGALAEEFAALMAAAGGNQAPAAAEDYTQSFSYGPLTVSLNPGTPDGEGYDTWYRIELPVWP